MLYADRIVMISQRDEHLKTCLESLGALVTPNHAKFACDMARQIVVRVTV